MRPIVAIAKRELRAYFTSPMGWLVMGVFMAFTGYFFWIELAIGSMASMRVWFSNATIMLIMLIPALTMRLVAEERQRGTIEVLMTSPVTDTQAILGKYIGGLLFYAAMLLLTIEFPITLKFLSNPDMGPIYAGYIGML